MATFSIEIPPDLHILHSTIKGVDELAVPAIGSLFIYFPAFLYRDVDKKWW